MDIIDPFAKKNVTDAIALGIDLGTTYTLASYLDDSKALKFITWDSAGHILLPSIVSFARQTVGDFYGEFSSSKRYMPEAFRVLKDNKTALDVAVEILRYVKEKTEVQTGKLIAHVVITVPAYFDDAARQATKIAGEKAGLVVRRIINEPTAAALAYNIDKEGVYAVYDFGGGTFDLSVLRMRQGIFQVLSTIGDLRLGGDDIDEAIAESLNISKIEAKALKESAAFQNYDSVVEPFIERTLKLSAKGLSDARIQKLDGVLLVGGSTRLAGLKDALALFFKAPVLDFKNPDLVVAEGAAIQSYALLHGSNHVLIDVAPLSIGLELLGGITDKIIQRNAPLPIIKEQMFTTNEDGQTGIEFHIVQGERELAADNRSLARFTLSNLTPLPKGNVKIKTQFYIDTDGLLTVTATDLLTEQNISVEIKPTFGLSSDDIKTYVLEGQTYAKEDIRAQQWIQKSMEAKQILEAAKYYKLENPAVEALESAVEDRDVIAIMRASETVITALKPLIEQKLNDDLKKALVGRRID